MATFTFAVGDTLTASVSYVDDLGNAAVVDGPTVWSTSDAAVATVADDGAGNVTISCVAVGACQIATHADADLGSGVRELVGMADLVVVAREAVAANIVLSKAA